MRLTPSFDVSEFMCRDGSPVPEELIETNLLLLCKTLQVIRDHIARPIVILSGYRSPAWNESVRGAKSSQHLKARAGDCRVAGMQPSELHSTIMLLYGQGALPLLGGLGLYLDTPKRKGFVHVDVRPRKRDGSIARWSGKGDE